LPFDRRRSRVLKGLLDRLKGDHKGDHIMKNSKAFFFTAILLVVCLYLMGCGGSKSKPLPQNAPALVEQTLQAFASDVNNQAPLVQEMKRAIRWRLTQDDTEVIARQYLHLLELSATNKPLVLDEQFIALLQRLSDMPYFAEFYKAATGQLGSATSGLHSTPGPNLTSAHFRLWSPNCQDNCANVAIADYTLSVGLQALGTFSNQFALVSNGAACADHSAALYECAANHTCTPADLFDLTTSCYGLTVSVIGAVLAIESYPALLSAVLITGAIVGTVTAAEQNDRLLEECEIYQQDNCCVAKIKCAATCCDSGYACTSPGICAKDNTSGCSGGESECGIYCCPSGTICSGGVCVWEPKCFGQTHLCGDNCCDESQYCGYDGACHPCDQTQLCGTSVCCTAGRFCNAVGQCLPESSGGCGELCGTGCCPPGQTCSAGECTGPTCPDGTCLDTLETPISCPDDCPSLCGDGTCQAFETATTCEADCKTDQEKCPLADSTGQEACEGIAQQVQAQCTAGGGNVTGWEITAGDCMTSYQCWVGCSPCVMYCSVKCGNDAQCGQDCLNEFGIDQTQAAEQCSGCGVPQVKALCEYPP